MKKIIKNVLGLVILTGVSLQASSSDLLSRTAFLGLVPETTDPREKVVVSDLHPSGSAQSLGLKVGDIIVEVNQQKVNNFSSLISSLKEVNEGSSLSVDVIREGKTLNLKAAAKGRPKESGKGYQVKYDAMKWQQELIRTISYSPDKPRADRAAVFFIQGYTCDSIDYGMMPDISLNQLLGGFAKQGFTVMKMEKPGVGDSEGKLDCTQYDFNLENDAFKAGLAHLKKQSKVNPDNVFVFGHSLGVLHAAQIANQGLAKGVIGYGGVLKSWHEYLQDIYAKQSVMYWGVSKDQAEQNSKTVAPFLADWLTTNKSWRDVLSAPQNKAAIDAGILPIDNELIFHRHYSFFRSLNNIDFEALWRNGKAHSLMLHGHYDIQAIEGKWANQIAELTSLNKPFVGDVAFFERTDHSLMHFKNKEDLMKVTRRQASGLGEYNHEITKESLAWMEKVLAL